MAPDPLAIKFSGALSWLEPLGQTGALFFGICTALSILAFFVCVLMVIVGIMKGAWSGQPDMEARRTQTIKALVAIPVTCLVAGFFIAALAATSVGGGTSTALMALEKNRAADYVHKKILAAISEPYADKEWLACIDKDLPPAVEKVFNEKRTLPPEDVVGIASMGAYIQNMWPRAQYLYAVLRLDVSFLYLEEVSAQLAKRGLPDKGKEKAWLQASGSSLLRETTFAPYVKTLTRDGDALKVGMQLDQPNHEFCTMAYTLLKIRTDMLGLTLSSDDACGPQGTFSLAMKPTPSALAIGPTLGPIGQTIKACAEKAKKHARI